ncbi:MAG: HTTM domain-containing protein [Bacteroidetes bacterium]|nr:HTTM domain-containing protein [Bacteroidota bacterium]HET6244207.1 HTTM domain-containing protein [Bacteroidia bacterium]
MEKISTCLKNIFTLELRSLALLRIGMGAVILLDLCIRITDLRAFYSDEGVLPLETLFSYIWSSWGISIYTISGLWQIQALLFMVSALFAFFLLIGYKTQLSCVLCWFFMLSLHARNPLILQAGDDLLRLVLFWGMFLPLGNYYSLDSLTKPAPLAKQVFNVATVGYYIQILSVYFFAALLKTSPEWRSEGTAIYYALSLDQMVLPLGKLIYPYPNLLKWMTHMVWYLELLVPFLFLMPYKTSFFRKAGILGLIFLHTGIALTLFVGLFYIIGIVTLFGTIPKDWAVRIDKKIVGIRLFPSSIFEQGTYGIGKYFHLNRTLKTPLNMPAKIFLVPRNFVLSSVIAYTLLLNWQTTEYTINYLYRYDIDFIGQFLRINQKWGMFSPAVFKEDGWYVLAATTYSGHVIDIGRKGKAVDYKKPKSVVAIIKNDRWRKFMENSIAERYSYMGPLYCKFMFKKWNDANPKNRIKDLRIIYVMETTGANYRNEEPVHIELAFISD